MGNVLTILAVDDEVAILHLIELQLTLDGMRVHRAHDGVEALSALADVPVDLVVLDVLMPHLDGFETLRAIRAYSTVPVIMLTASTQEPQRVRMLAAGADDCLTKPFNPDELSARIRTILRRVVHPEGSRDCLDYGGLVIDLGLRRVTWDGTEVRLSRTEWELLVALAQEVGKVQQSQHLLMAVWGEEYADETQYLHTWISRLRRKLGVAAPITTFPAVGYRLEPPANRSWKPQA